MSERFFFHYKIELEKEIVQCILKNTVRMNSAKSLLFLPQRLAAGHSSLHGQLHLQQSKGHAP